jgi:hypothetical protein
MQLWADSCVDFTLAWRWGFCCAAAIRGKVSVDTDNDINRIR